jgi:hypothetical protein
MALAMVAMRLQTAENTPDCALQNDTAGPIFMAK